MEQQPPLQGWVAEQLSVHCEVAALQALPAGQSAPELQPQLPPPVTETHCAPLAPEQAAHCPPPAPQAAAVVPDAQVFP